MRRKNGTIPLAHRARPAAAKSDLLRRELVLVPSRTRQHPHAVARQAHRPLGVVVVLVFVPGIGERIDHSCSLAHGTNGLTPNLSPQSELGILFGYHSKKGLAQRI